MGNNYRSFLFDSLFNIVDQICQEYIRSLRDTAEDIFRIEHRRSEIQNDKEFVYYISIKPIQAGVATFEGAKKDITISINPSKRTLVVLSTPIAAETCESIASIVHSDIWKVSGKGGRLEFMGIFNYSKYK